MRRWKNLKQKESRNKITIFLRLLPVLLFSTMVVLFGNKIIKQNILEQNKLYEELDIQSESVESNNAGIDLSNEESDESNLEENYSENDNYDKMYIESAKIESRKTGTGPFNEGSGTPEAGEDYLESDNYVRTFDVVKYTLSAIIQPNTSASGVDETSTFNGGVVKFKGKIEDATYFTWQEDAWMKNVVISEDGKEIYAEYIVPESQLTAPGTKTLTVTLKARGIATKEGEKAPTPTFEIWMDGNVPDNSSSAKNSVTIKDTTDLYISGKGAFNIKLTTGDINNKGTYNGKSGYYMTYGIQIGLMQDKEKISDLRGLEYPKGEFVTELELEYLYKETDSSDEYQVVPNVDDIELIAYSINNVKNDSYWPSSNVVIRNLVAGTKNGIWTNLTESKTVCNSGSFDVRKENNKIITTFNNFNFNDVFPDKNIGNSDTEKLYGTNEGYFAVGCIEIFVPYYEPESQKSYDYTVNITTNNANYATSTIENGSILMGKTSIDDVYKSDNKITNSMTKRANGTFWGYLDFYKDNKLLNSLVSIGDAYYTLDNIIRVDDVFSIGKDPYLGGEERISVWRGDIFTYIGNLKVNTESFAGFPNPSTDNITYKYGIYKNNPSQGVTTDELVENADFEDFEWYSTDEEAKEHGKITAIYVNDPDHVGYSIRRSLRYDLQITDNENYICTNPIFRHKFRIYENEDRSGNMYKYAYEKYSNTVYGEDGSFESNHSPYEYGGNLLLVPYHVTVKKTVSDVDSNGNMKKAYDVQDGYVNFVITPYLTNNKGAKDSDAIVDLVTLTDTLPAGLTYIEGSSNKEPVSIERNEETGETTIVWEYRNWQINHSPDVPQITYKTEIDASLKNNASIENKVVIKTAKDISRVASRTSIYGVIISNLSGLQIDKTTETPVVEINDDLVFNLNINNSSDKSLSNVKVLDILPYNSDENTTSYNGSYTVKSVEVDDGTEIYYTTISPNELETKGGLTKDINGKLNPNSVNLESNTNWIKSIDGKVDENTTAIIAVISKLAAHSNLKLNYVLAPNGNKAGDIYGSRASIIAEGFSSVVKSNLAIDTVIKRSISGMVFEDCNQNGIKEVNEKNLMGIEVNLLNEDLSEVVDVMGNKVESTITDENGYYEFTNLKVGKYIVEFKIDGTSYVATRKLVGEDETVNSNINEIPVNKAKTDVIEGLNKNKIKEENINAGIYKKVEKKVIVLGDENRTEVKEGEELEYSIKYTNKTEENEKIVVTDKVPEGTVYVGDVKVSVNEINVLENVTIIEPTEENGELRVETKEEFLKPGEEIKVTFKVRVKKVEEGLKVNKITNRANVEHNEKVVPTVDADIVVENLLSKSVDVGNLTEVKSEEILTYSIKYTNITGNEESIIIKDSAPEGTKYVGEVEVLIGDENAKDKMEIVEPISEDMKLTVSTKEGIKLKEGETIEVRFKVKVKTKEEGLAVEEITNIAEVEHNGEVLETNEVKNLIEKEIVDTSDIHILIYVIIFLVAVVGIVVGIIIVKNIKK